MPPLGPVVTLLALASVAARPSDPFHHPTGPQLSVSLPAWAVLAALRGHWQALVPQTSYQVDPALVQEVYAGPAAHLYTGGADAVASVAGEGGPDSREAVGAYHRAGMRAEGSQQETLRARGSSGVLALARGHAEGCGHEELATPALFGAGDHSAGTDAHEEGGSVMEKLQLAHRAIVLCAVFLPFMTLGIVLLILAALLPGRGDGVGGDGVRNGGVNGDGAGVFGSKGRAATVGTGLKAERGSGGETSGRVTGEGLGEVRGSGLTRGRVGMDFGNVKRKKGTARAAGQRGERGGCVGSREQSPGSPGAAAMSGGASVSSPASTVTYHALRESTTPSRPRRSLGHGDAGTAVGHTLTHGSHAPGVVRHATIVSGNPTTAVASTASTSFHVTHVVPGQGAWTVPCRAPLQVAGADVAPSRGGKRVGVGRVVTSAAHNHHPVVSQIRRVDAELGFDLEELGQGGDGREGQGVREGGGAGLRESAMRAAWRLLLWGCKGAGEWDARGL